MKMTKKGFTLTEVLVVVLIISVLAAIVYPMYTKSVTRSRAVEAMNLLEMVRNKQLQKFARDKEYYTDLSKVGQLTTDTSKVTVDGDKLKVNDYTLSLDTVKNCMRAEYKKGSTEFTFSASYDKAGLGCSGAICSSFGNITSTADEVCGCNLTCSGGFTLDSASCTCVCSECTVGGQCVPPFQNQPLSESCGNGGVRTRTCTASCAGGDCSAWGLCGGQDCDNALKPTASQACGNCGTQTRAVTCNQNTGVWSTGAWGSCSGSGVCSPGATQTCNGGGTQTCSATCSWGACSTVSCDQATKPSASQACGNCGTQTRTVTCNTTTGTWTTGSWGACSGGGVCSPGATQSCSGGGTQTCSSTCAWSACSSTDCDNTTKPGATQACGNCGTQTRTVTCDTTTGTWTTGTWDTCTGTGECTPGATNTGGCPNNQAGYIIKTCNSSCQWAVTTTNCQAVCQPSTTTIGGPTYLFFSEAASADTCDGTPASQFSCSGPKTCVDSIKMGGCVDSGGTSYTPDWTGGPYKYQKGSGYPTTASFASKPSSTCQYSATQMVLGSSGPYDAAFARSVCMQQCYAIGLPYGYGCDASCRVVGNCWPESNNAGYNCQIFDLSCTAVELKCQTLKYNKVCC